VSELDATNTAGAPWLGPTMLRAYLTLGLLLAWLLAPVPASTVVVLVGVASLVLSAAELLAAWRLEARGRPAGLLRALGPLAGGVVLLAGPQDGLDALFVAVGALLLVRGLADALATVTVGRDAGLAMWLGGLSAAELIGAAVVLLLPVLFGPAVLVALGLSWIGAGALGRLVPVSASVRRVTVAPVPRRESMPAEDRARVVDELLLGGGEDIRDRLVRFVVLLGIATIIATYGVLGDSAAAVIGGMIVAPLMTPIQALTVALVSGAVRRALGAAAVLVGGVALVLALSVLIALTYRDLAVELLNAQVVSRTSPTLPDLAIALAAGAAGGFALTRRDVAASLPGVAIAVSLVPPLCVSGASLAGGEGGDAVGAFLLFLVNFVAIVLATGATLVLSGFGSTAGRHRRRLLTLTAGFATALVALAVPLAVSGLTTLRDEDLDSAVRNEVVLWLEPVEPAEIIDVEVEGTTVTVLVAAASRPPAPDVLEDRISEDVGRPVTVSVRWIRSVLLE
jgi:uncharacterized hydrophobic protein (TIGR00271 family)